MRKKTTIFTVVMISLGVALALWGVLANTRALEPQMQAGGTPNLISYQGYLTDVGGQPIDGTPDLEFGIYAALTGGTPLWSELQLNVPVNEGYFTVQLGSFTPIDAGLFSDPDRYLQVSVNSGGGFVDLPRQPFTAVPYALQAANAWSLAGNSGTDPTIHRLGTTDAVSLTLVVSDTAVMRFDPAIGNFPWGERLDPNITANPFSNEIQAGVYGSTISGGVFNQVAGNYATVGGGLSNEAAGDYATVGGGSYHVAECVKSFETPKLIN